MASKSSIEYLAQSFESQVHGLVTRLSFVAPGTPESDRAADLLRKLAAQLAEADLQATDIRNAAAARRG